MAIQVCTKLCGECPFSRDSLQGFLADYSVEDLSGFMQADTLFPCHKVLPERYNKTSLETSDLVRKGHFKLCRGYIESLIKSCVSPKSQELKGILKEVRASGLSDMTMPMWEFKKYHDLYGEPKLRK